MSSYLNSLDYYLGVVLNYLTVYEIKPFGQYSFSLQLGILKANNRGLTTVKLERLLDKIEEMGLTSYIRHIDLTGNALVRLPDRICNLTNLRVLKAGKNQITEIPARIGNLTNLVTLWFPENSIPTIPDSLWDLCELDSLDLESNLIREVSSRIGNLTKVRQIDLQANLIRELPDRICELNLLRDLRLHSNPITVFPESVRDNNYHIPIQGLPKLMRAEPPSLGLERDVQSLLAIVAQRVLEQNLVGAKYLRLHQWNAVQQHGGNIASTQLCDSPELKGLREVLKNTSGSVIHALVVAAIHTCSKCHRVFKATMSLQEEQWPYVYRHIVSGGLPVGAFPLQGLAYKTCANFNITLD